VGLASHGDQRSAYEFLVNPAGVKRDQFAHDDNIQDGNWNAVWDASVTQDKGGWTVEMKIPLSQLRFQEGLPLWGLQVARTLSRRGEFALWAPVARTESGWVSRYGELRGVQKIKSPQRLELRPYLMGRGLFPEEVSDDPFSGRSFDGGAGLDLKYGLGGKMTLDATLNPDFGQVEMDPAEINLSAFETQLEERRSFFQEGADIFNFNGPKLFYSRRIGRAPQGSPEGAYIDSPDWTTILGALRLTARDEVWSIGVLEAVTQEERARVQMEDGSEHEEVVEPLTQLFVARLQRHFRGGESSLGAILTSSYRLGDEVPDLRREAIVGGLDWEHRWDQRRWRILGHAALSHVRGSKEAIEETQSSSAHYFQRPDAHHLSLDPERSQLTGGSGELRLEKFGGPHWRMKLGLQAQSPEFEINDLGYLNQADLITPQLWLSLRDDEPDRFTQRIEWSNNLDMQRNFAGDNLRTGGQSNLYVHFSNYWGAWLGASYRDESLCTACTWGGPALRIPSSLSVWTGFHSDDRKSVYTSLESWRWLQTESGTWGWGFNLPTVLRPSSSLELKLEPRFSVTQDDFMWVGEEEGRYIFAAMDQLSFSMALRVNFNFHPDLSLQLYAEPFFSRADYEGFKEIERARAPHYRDLFRPLDLRSRADGELGLSQGETVFDLSDPDYRRRQLRSNLVLRWEYLPGSTLYLVWQHSNIHQETGKLWDLGALFSPEAEREEILMLKLDYWMNP